MTATLGIWIVSVVGFGILALAAIGAIYQGAFDCDYAGTPESANSLLGWAIAAFATLMPMAIAYAVAMDRARAAVLVIAVVTAGLELWTWWWILNPVCHADVGLGLAAQALLQRF
jgi:hypothetical protein